MLFWLELEIEILHYCPNILIGRIEIVSYPGTAEIQPEQLVVRIWTYNYGGGWNPYNCTICVLNDVWKQILKYWNILIIIHSLIAILIIVVPPA